MITIQQVNALNKFAQMHGRGWREQVICHWVTGSRPRHLSLDEAACLQQIRNQYGPDFLQHFKPHGGDYAGVVYLKKDRMERFNLKRGWFVTAWRLVDAVGVDRVQPWASTKGEARAQAKALNLYLVETNETR